MFGILVIDKTSGISSRQVVTRIQRMLPPGKAGHAGTLDPMATGILVVCVGPATRLIPYVHQLAKSYTTTARFGLQSNTDDIWGDVSSSAVERPPGSDHVRAVVESFVGSIDQVPPAVSAVKIAGQRAYKLSRAGKPVKLAARKVEIHSIEVVRYDFPDLFLNVRCGSGTYIRALVRDIGQRLGCPAVMASLRRTAIGNFDTRRAIHADRLELPEMRDELPRALLDPIEAVRHLPQTVVADDQLRQLAAGTPIALHDKPPAGGDVAALDSRGRLTAVLRPMSDGRHKPAVNFLPYLGRFQ